jgi:hypothetical protein
MSDGLRLRAFRLALLTALAGSALESGWLPRPGACAACAPTFGLVLGGVGLPLPWLGLAGAALLLALSYCPGGLALRLRTGLSLAGGGAALALLLLQGGLFRSLCPACLVIDGALLLAALIEATRKAAPAPSASRAGL